MEPHRHHEYGVHVEQTGGGDRFPQWGIQEARDFLMIRGELDAAFMETKRNKLLWEVIATKMREKGYNRSAEQCKYKWKNLVTRYKGCETMENENMRQQFPLYNEMQTIFTARMQRMLWTEAEGSASGSKKKAMEESSEEGDDYNKDSDHEERGSIKKKRKRTKDSSASSRSANVMNSLREILEDFIKQQRQIEKEWVKAYEAREEERRRREMEWRQTMEALEKERLMMERRWREREGQRRVREEARSEKRDALITALLQKLTRED